MSELGLNESQQCYVTLALHYHIYMFRVYVAVIYIYYTCFVCSVNQSLNIASLRSIVLAGCTGPLEQCQGCNFISDLDLSVLLSVKMYIFCSL